MIRCQEVCKGYRLGDRAVEALRGVTFSIETPGFYGIMGQSGSGKSTLLHLLGALDRPTSGIIEIDGVSIGTLSDAEATRFRLRRIGMIFQQFNLIPTLSARENVELPALLAGEPKKWVASRSAELLERLDIADRGEHRPEAMSGGEQQRVAIARALVFSPSVILADEPTGNLDSASSERLWDLLEQVAREQEATIVMVTHEPAAAAHCRRVIIIRDGRVLGKMETEGLDAGGVAAGYQQLVGAALA
jgi:putative ABC transport system ATP-binding protein